MYNYKIIKNKEKKGSLTVLTLKTHGPCHWIGSATNKKATNPNPE
jgi:hypothetical protein